jgi:predicted SnoaL-like aldol condensation-catalyzing enzyme
MKRVVYVAAFVFAAMLIPASVSAQAGKAPVGQAQPEVDPAKMGGKIAIACNYERDLWIGHKYELLDKYVTSDYVAHHNGQPDTKGMADWKAWSMARPQPKAAPGGGCSPVTYAIEKGNFVLFVRQRQVPDPKDPTKMVTQTFMGLWRFVGKKIAEHWG